MLGLGAGVAYHHHLGAGLDVAPRVGARFLVGKHAVPTAALSYSFVTTACSTPTPASR